MSRSALLFAIAFSLCVAFFGCNKTGPTDVSVVGINLAMVGIYIGDQFNRRGDNGVDESEANYGPYYHQLNLNADGTFYLNHLAGTDPVVDTESVEIEGYWTEQGGDTLNLFPTNLIPGNPQNCYSIAVGYTIDGADLTLTWDHQCGDEFISDEYYTLVANAPSLVGEYFGDEFDQLLVALDDDDIVESEQDYWPYYHQLNLRADGTFNLNRVLNGSCEYPTDPECNPNGTLDTILVEIEGYWTEHDGETLKLFPSTTPGCASIAVVYTIDGPDLTLFWDNACGDEYLRTEPYTLITIVPSLVGDYFGDEFDLVPDEGVDESELDYWPYYHQLSLYNDGTFNNNGTFNLKRLLNGNVLVEIEGYWTEHGGDTLKLYTRNISGCTDLEDEPVERLDVAVVEVGYTFVDQDLTLFWDHQCGDESLRTEPYTLIANVPSLVGEYDGTEFDQIVDDGVGNFADSSQALGNSYSYDVALGDLDGDGDLDAWVANGSNQVANRVWINDGLGNFADSSQALGNSNSYGVALGDLDGDGDLDAWVANSGQGNRVWINDGLGNFADSSQALGDSNSYGVALDDLDGDGDLDAWVANYNQPNRVWVNQGGDQGGVAGNFVDSGQALGNSNSYGVALGDLDGDDDLDAWVANSGQGNRVWINDGLGNFADSGQALGSSNSRSVALGDLDGDGDLDAWVANYNQPNRVWINQGGDQGGVAGNFADRGQELGNSQSTGFALGDLDGDDDLDAWVANSGQGNRVWINQGGDQGGVAGNFADSSQALGNSVSYGVALGDLDGDGDLDAWVANWVGQANRVWINDVLVESELDYFPYTHLLNLDNDGTFNNNGAFNLEYIFDFGESVVIEGYWTEQGGDTLNLFPSNQPGCTRIAVGYTLDGPDLTLTWDHQCTDDTVIRDEYYTIVD